MSEKFLSETSCLPFWLIRLKGRPEQDDLDALFVALDGVLDRGERCLCLVDFSDVGIPTEARNREVIALFKERKGRLNSLVIAAAIMIRSPFVRIVINSITAILPTKYPTRIFTDPTEAAKFLRAQSIEAGLDVRAELCEEVTALLIG